ncbi:MAG: metallophosphoesterase [Cyanobacteria bacterium P01_G01_bin.54]
MQRLKWILLTSLAVGLCLLFYGTQIEPQWLEVRSQTATLPHLDPAFNGFKLVQLSDLHVHSLRDRLRRDLVQNLQQQQPELIVLTGDFAGQGDDLATVGPELETVLKEIRAIAPTLAVLGNHDYWLNPQWVQEVLQRAEIPLLKNEIDAIERSSARLYLGGVDDAMVGRDRLGQVLAQLPPEGAVILLVHEPDFADTAAATGRFDLELSGHSHGGQIRLGKPLILPPWGRNYPAGWYQVGTMQHYTNRGLGTTVLPLRLGSRPEMTVFRLKAEG